MRGALSSLSGALRGAVSYTLSWAIALASILLLVACAAESGEPWGRVSGLELLLSWESSASRVHPDGGWRTSTSFRVYDLHVTIDYEELTLLSLDEGSSAIGGALTAIDPSAPPAGCTLCHGGHCHCGGELIDYAELLSRGATEGGGGGSSPLLRLAESWRGVLSLGGDAEGEGALDQSSLSCEGARCDLGAGSLRGLSLRLPRVALSFMVEDLLNGESRRLTEPERVELELALPTSLELSFDKPVALGQGSQPADELRALTLRLSHTLNPTLFDIDWSQLSAELELELLSALIDLCELELVEP